MAARVTHALTSRWGSLVVIVIALAFTALAFASSPDQPPASPTDGLPAGKQSTRVTELVDRFPSGRTTAAVVVYERPDAKLTEADTSAIADDPGGARGSRTRWPGAEAGRVAGRQGCPADRSARSVTSPRTR